MNQTAQVLTKYPLAMDTDANYTNVTVYQNDHGQFLPTNIKCKVPNSLTNDLSFRGVTPCQQHDDVVYIVREDNGRIRRSITFLCLKCMLVHEGSVSNVERHLQSGKHRTHIDSLDPSEATNLAVAWFTKHHIPFNAIADPLFRLLVPGISSIGAFKECVQNSVNIVTQKIHDKVQKASFVTAAADGWNTNRGRNLGIAFHTTSPDGNTDVHVVGLKEAPDTNLGANEIANIVDETIKSYDIPKDKVIGFLSDSAADMIASARKLNLSSDHCYNHILSNIIEKGFDLLPERVDRILSIATNLHGSAKWKEYFNKIYKQGDETLENHVNFIIGNDTRWGTKIEQCLDLLKFRNAIEGFYQYHSIIPQPNNLLPSDFELLSDLEDPFNFISNEIKKLQCSECNLARIMYSMIQIADKADAFIEDKIECQKKAQENADRYHLTHPNEKLQIVPVSHLVPAFEFIRNTIIHDIIENSADCEMRMKAALLLDPAIPLTPFPAFCVDQFEIVEEWIQTQIEEEEEDSQNEQSDQANSQKPKRFYETKLSSFSSQSEDNKMTFRYWLDHLRPLGERIDDPLKYWSLQESSTLQRFALKIFSHKVSNASMEGFFSICKGFIGLDGHSMDIKTIENLGLLSANHKILYEEIVTPIRNKYRR